MRDAASIQRPPVKRPWDKIPRDPRILDCDVSEMTQLVAPETDTDPLLAPRSEFSAERLLDLLLTDAKDAEEIAVRALVLAMVAKHPNAPDSMEALATWLNVSRSTARRKWTAVLQCFQGFARSW